ncbi:MAG: TIGR04086 family membrane protein [Ruminococcus sp.]|nr:TIGR04086 family membrane protein [Candidatus Apopatosoma intestinale]
MAKTVAKSGGGTFIPLLKALLICALAGAILLSGFCLLALRFDDPEKVAPIFSFATLAILSFLGGRISACLRGENGALCGLLFGLLMAAVMIALAFAMSLAIDPLTYASAAAGAVGMAVLGGRGAEKKKPGKRRRKKR